MLSHCKNNVIHCKINDICIAWTLTLCKNNAIHCENNDICSVWMRSHCKNNAIHCKINDVCIECAILYPNVDCVLLSYHCHTFCHTVVIPWASIWSLGRFCQFCLAVLSTNLPRRMCQANLPHVVTPCCHTLLSYPLSTVVVIPGSMCGGRPSRLARGHICICM